MEELYKRAREVYEEDLRLSKRYTELIMKIAQRTRTKIPKHIKRNICKNCGVVQIQGVNSHTRIRQRREPHVARTCHVCGYITRIPLGEKEKTVG